MNKEPHELSRHALAISYVNNLLIDLRLIILGQEAVEPVTMERLDEWWHKHRKDVGRCKDAGDNERLVDRGEHTLKKWPKIDGRL